MLQSDSGSRSTNPRASFVMEQQLGHATYYQNLYNQLAGSKELDIHWVKAWYNPAQTIWEKIPGIPHRTRNILGAYSHVRAGLRAKPWDVAFFNTHVPARMAGLLRNRGPYVVTSDITPILHDPMSEYYGRPVDTNPLSRSYKHRSHTTMFQGAAKLLPWSKWVRDSLIADYGVDPEKIEVVPPGVDLEQWLPRRSHTEGHDGGSSRVNLLFVGGDFHRKGGERLLKVFARLPQEQVHLDVVTKTNLAVEAIMGHQNITIHQDLESNAPELLALYRSSDLFVFPTQAEAFGIAAVEAAAVGLPVVASNVGGLEDIVLHGRTGFLFDPNDEQLFLECLNRLIASPTLRLEMGKAARQHACSHFDLHRNAARTLEIILEVAQSDYGLHGKGRNSKVPQASS